MKYHLKNHIYERVKQAKNVVDTDLLVELNKNGWNISMMDLNKILLQLEIVGLITVHWMGKDKRRIEIVESVSSSVE